MITSQQACLLFSYDFKLVDKEGNEHSISGIHDVLMLKNNIWVEFDKIGIDYFVLAYHHSCLTKDEYFDTYIELCEELEVNSLEYFIEALINDTAYTMKIKDYDSAKDFLLSKHFLPHGIEESNVKYIND